MTKITKQHSIRGEEYKFTYDKETQNLEIVCKNILDSLNIESHKTVQQSLQSIGIYTRIQKIHAHKKDKITVKLKPAASVELRDKNGQLVKRVVSNNFNGNVISKRTTGYQYTATISSDVLKETEFEHKQKVHIKPYLENNYLCFAVSEQDDPPRTTLQIKSTGTGVITIPSVLGSMADIDGHGINWEIETGRLYGRTTYSIPRLDQKETEEVFTSEVINVKQQGMDNGESFWDQERFQTYFPLESEIEQQITDEMYFELRFISINGELAVQYLLRDQDCKTTNAPHIKPIYLFGNNQRNIYLPNSLVYGLEWDRQTLQWIITSNGLVSKVF